MLQKVRESLALVSLKPPFVLVLGMETVTASCRHCAPRALLLGLGTDSYSIEPLQAASSCQCVSFEIRPTHVGGQAFACLAEPCLGCGGAQTVLATPVEGQSGCSMWGCQHARLL